MKIDLSYLEEITGGEVELMIELIDLFINETPNQFKKIRSHYSDKNWRNLKSEIHKFKPTLDYVGLNNVKQIASRVEVLCSSKSKVNEDELKSLIDEIERAFVESKLALEKKKVQLMAQRG